MTLFITLLFFIAQFAKANVVDTLNNPFVKYSPLWNQTKYKHCNTAAAVSYLTDEEKKIIWALNMIRLSPQLYCKTILLNPKSPFYLKPAQRDYYFNSLINDLNKSTPNNNFLQPDSMAFISAQCHAYYSGIKGYVGHERSVTLCKGDFYGECCDYGYNDAVSILTHLLIDKNISDLGHRNICLSKSYSLLGTSIQPHRDYYMNTVLDFK